MLFISYWTCRKITPKIKSIRSKISFSGRERERIIDCLFSLVQRPLESYRVHRDHYNENREYFFLDYFEVNELNDLLNHLYCQCLELVVLKQENKLILSSFQHYTMNTIP
jgi:hypothetical protein